MNDPILTTKYAVFVFSEYMTLPLLNNPAVVLFPDQDSAEKWLVNTLVENGCISRADGEYIVDGTVCETARQAIEGAQMEFEPSEFAHIYEVYEVSQHEGG